jgi:hypothetical protein
LCRRDDTRCVGQMTDAYGAAGHTGRSRSMPVGYPGRRMIEHDCNTAAQQAGYPVGEEHGPDPPALEQGTGRDLTCQPHPRRQDRAGHQRGRHPRSPSRTTSPSSHPAPPAATSNGTRPPATRRRSSRVLPSPCEDHLRPRRRCRLHLPDRRPSQTRTGQPSLRYASRRVGFPLITWRHRLKSDAGRRAVVIPAVITPDLTWHLARFTAPSDDALVFTSRNGAPLRHTNFRRRHWLPALRQTGLTNVHFHDLRRARLTSRRGPAA